jgi:SOS-response transcriptional repressor LexA
MKDIGNRIQKSRLALGLTQLEVAERLGVSHQAVQKWESGISSPKGARLKDVATELDVSLEYLLYGTITHISKVQPEANTEAAPELRSRVPLISWVQAGAWAEVMDNFAPGDAEDWYRSTKNTSPHTFALRVRGVSMEPKFHDGDIIFVDPEVHADHNRFVVVRLEGEAEATFKQLVVEGNQRFLRALNPDWPGEKLIKINGNATICGVVIGKWTEV